MKEIHLKKYAIYWKMRLFKFKEFVFLELVKDLIILIGNSTMLKIRENK